MPVKIEFGEPRSVEDVIREEALRQGVNPDLAVAIAREESGLRQSAVSPKGAIGVMQLMPSTAAELGVDPRNELQNIRGGVAYFRLLLDRYKGDMAKALAAYNAGMGRVESGQPLPLETQQYVASITKQRGENGERIHFGEPRDYSERIHFGEPREEFEPEEPVVVAPKPGGPLAKEEKPGLFTGSLVERATGTTTAKAYEKLLSKLGAGLPPSVRQNYVAQVVAEVSKAGPEMMDFLFSPAGIALIGAHLFPATAPFAAAVDVGLGIYGGAHSIPSVVDAAKNPRDPKKVGRAIVDIAMPFMGLKIGKHVGRAVRATPAEVRRGAPLLKAYGRAFRSTAPPPAVPPGRDLVRRMEQTAPEDRPALIAELERPASVAAKFENWLYHTPLVKDVAKLVAPKAKMPPLMSLSQELVDRRIGGVNVELNRVRRVIDDIERSVPEEDLSIRRMGYALEGDLPETSLSPQAREGLQKIRELNRERDRLLREVYGDDLQLMDSDTYLRHYWDFDSPADPAVKRWISTRRMKDPSLRKRKVMTLKEGIEGFIDNEGRFIKLNPKYERITDVIRRRHQEAVYAAENQRFANTLRDYGLIIDPTRANMRNTGWRQAIDADPLKRAVYAGKGERGEAIMREKAPLVHPDVEAAVNAVFASPSYSSIFYAANAFRGLSKQIQVGASLFHNNELAQVSMAEAFAAGGRRTIPRALRAIAWPADPEFVKGVRAAIWEVRGRRAPDAPPDVRLRREIIEPWLRAGLESRSAEYEALAIKAMMDFKKNAGPIARTLGAPIRGMGKAQHVFSRALFDYYLPGQMVHTGEALLLREMNRVGPKRWTPELESITRREIADHLNRNYGVENLQRLLLTPKAQQALAFIFFAPMWTLSNLRVLSKGYETTAGARLTNRYIAGAALTFFLTTQLTNYAMSEWYARKYPTGGEYWDEEAGKWKRGGHWTWQNPGNPLKIGKKYVPGVTDNVVNIYFGQNPDGSSRYIRLGKAIREPFLWIIEPLKTFGGKLSTPLRQLIVQYSKNEPGTGFPAINPKLTEGQQMQQRLAEGVEMFVPFSLQQQYQQLLHRLSPHVFQEPAADTQWFGLPTRKGASFYESVADLREALESGRMDVAMAILHNARLNKIDPQRLIRELRERKFREARTAMGVRKWRTTQPPPQEPEIEFGEPRSVEE